MSVGCKPILLYDTRPRLEQRLRPVCGHCQKPTSAKPSPGGARFPALTNDPPDRHKSVKPRPLGIIRFGGRVQPHAVWRICVLRRRKTIVGSCPNGQEMPCHRSYQSTRLASVELSFIFWPLSDDPYSHYPRPALGPARDVCVPCARAPRSIGVRPDRQDGCSARSACAGRSPSPRGRAFGGRTRYSNPLGHAATQLRLGRPDHAIGHGGIRPAARDRALADG